MRWLAAALFFSFGVFAAADDPPELDPFVAQFVPNLRQMLKSELRFARAVCEPTPEQFQKIEAGSNATFNVVLKKASDSWQQFQRGREPKENTEPQQLIAESVAKAVEKELTEEQAARYRQELQKRREARQHATVINAVAQIDRQLGLNAEQREQLVNVLNKDWKNQWGQLEAFQASDDGLPMLPDQLVTPVLNAKQRELWKSAPKRMASNFGWMQFGVVQVIEVEAVPEAKE